MALLNRSYIRRVAKILAIAQLSAPAAFAADVAGKVVSVTGKALARVEGDSSQPVRQLKAGDPIHRGEVVNTASNSTAKLLMTDKSIFDLAPSTLFNVAQYKIKEVANREVEMTVAYGKIRASVNTPVKGGKFMIRTKSATLGVRGTEFIVATDLNEASAPEAGKAAKPAQASTQITVIEGKVAVTQTAAPATRPIEVTEGEQLTTVAALAGDTVVGMPAQGESPKVVELSQTELQSEMQTARVEDTTFSQAIILDTGSADSGSRGPASDGASGGGAATFAQIESTVTLAESFDSPKLAEFASPVGSSAPSFAPPVPTQDLYRPNAELTVVFRK